MEMSPDRGAGSGPTSNKWPERSLAQVAPLGRARRHGGGAPPALRPSPPARVRRSAAQGGRSLQGQKLFSRRPAPTPSRGSPTVGIICRQCGNDFHEMFIQHLAKSAYSIAKKKEELHYNDIAESVERNANMSFVKELIPRTTTWSKYRELMVAKGLTIEYESSEEESDETGSISSQE
ncbi:uncharacterized protein GBIM_10877 [Gryllus bimaculatus]|nr:uncharacterized protein GBIM_10877 [Gryllus bimaculatus]